MDCGGPNPGPAYAFKTLTGYEGHDFSKYRAPAWSLGLRPTGPSGPHKTPGPYNVGNVDRNGRYPYKGWTMESRGAPPVRGIGPGPLDYPAPKLSPGPAYSLGLKLPPPSRPFGPSAADYYPQISGGPAFSIGSGRKSIKAPVEIGPGPAADTPLNLYKSKSPAYSLGLKGPSIFGGSVGPGPKYYPIHPSRQGYSFGVKHHKCSPPLITYEDRDVCGR